MEDFSRYTFCKHSEFHEGRGQITKFQIDLPDSVQTIVITPFCYAIFPTPGIDFHIRGTIQAVPNRGDPLL